MSQKNDLSMLKQAMERLAKAEAEITRLRAALQELEQPNLNLLSTQKVGEMAAQQGLPRSANPYQSETLQRAWAYGHDQRWAVLETVKEREKYKAALTGLRHLLGICHAALDPTMPPLRPGAREQLMQDIRVALWGPTERPACNRKETP